MKKCADYIDNFDKALLKYVHYFKDPESIENLVKKQKNWRWIDFRLYSLLFSDDYPINLRSIIESEIYYQSKNDLMHNSDTLYRFPAYPKRMSIFRQILEGTIEPEFTILLDGRRAHPFNSKLIREHHIDFNTFNGFGYPLGDATNLLQYGVNVRDKRRELSSLAFVIFFAHSHFLLEYELEHIVEDMHPGQTIVIAISKSDCDDSRTPLSNLDYLTHFMRNRLGNLENLGLDKRGIKWCLWLIESNDEKHLTLMDVYKWISAEMIIKTRGRIGYLLMQH